jgi:hypothetical protein
MFLFAYVKTLLYLNRCTLYDCDLYVIAKYTHFNSTFLQILSRPLETLTL